MAIKILVPTPLRSITKGAAEVTVEGKNIKEVIDRLEGQYKGLKDRLCDGDGKIRRFVNIYVNEEDVRFLKNEDTELKGDEVISIVPAIAGGCLL